MAISIDPRMLRVMLDFDGNVKTYENLAIECKGSKYASPTQNEATIRICNLDRDTRADLLTRASPFITETNRQPIKVTVEAGRKSWGYASIYQGNVTEVQMSQPPDIWAILKCKTKQFTKGENVFTEVSPVSKVSTIAAVVASQLGVRLDFQATDKFMVNYVFTGPAVKQIEKIQKMGFYDVFIDDETLVVKDSAKPLELPTKLVNVSNGMIGVPEFTDFGVKIKYFIDRSTKIGAPMQVESEFYPTTSGTYQIYRLDFDITNRNTSFYYIANGKRLTNVNAPSQDRVRAVLS